MAQYQKPSEETRAGTTGSPEAAPPYVVLAEVLELGGLDDQLVNLLIDSELVLPVEIPAGELLRDAVQDLDGSGILDLGHVGSAIAVRHAAGWGGRGIGARSAARSWWRAAHQGFHPSPLGSEELGRRDRTVED